MYFWKRNMQAKGTAVIPKQTATISDKTLWTKYKNKVQVQCIRPPHPLSRVGEGGSWYICLKHFYISF